MTLALIERLGPDWLPATEAGALALPTELSAGPAGEAAIVASTVPRRQQHFRAGRACAHSALAALGRDVPVLGRTEGGGADWPAGTVGAIAHCDALAAAIVASTADWLALGLDVEPDAPLPEDACRYALTAAEREAFAARPGGLARWALPAFSAKECVHKCLHPLRGAFLDFDEVAIDFDAADGFVPRPLSAAAIDAFAGLRMVGRWLRWRGCVVVLLGVPASER